MTGPWKILTHDGRPPIRGGQPIWDGVTLPCDLPAVDLDRSEGECGAGWNFTADLAAGFRVAGLWPTGRPSRVLVVEPVGEVVERGGKLRTDRLRLVREATEDEIASGVRALSEPFGEHAEHMAASQIAWRQALARPSHDPESVEAGLREALATRGLSWDLRRHETAQAAWATWGAWEAWAAWVAWEAWEVRETWEAWAAWEARAAWVARETWAAWEVRETWEAWAAWVAWEARDALTVEYAALQGWVSSPPDLLTRGLRDAYRSGLGIAVPVADGVLGWAMEEKP